MKIFSTYFTMVFAISIFASSCEVGGSPDEFYCDVAEFCIRNPTSDKVVVYSWGSSRLEDTIFPGECATKTATGIYKDRNSSSNYYIYFTTAGSETMYLFDECYEEYDAPHGYIDLWSDCENGVFNPESGELDTDCGGYCKDCPSITMPCQLSSDWVDFGGKLTSSDAYLGYVNSIDHMLSFSLSHGFIDVQFDIIVPPEGSRRFVTGNSFHEVYIKYSNGFDDYPAAPGQDVYLKKIDNGNWIVEFCDLLINIYGEDVKINASMSFELRE